MKKVLLLFILFNTILFTPGAYAETAGPSVRLAAETLLGEKLTYNISFLWFKKIARGEISLTRGDRPGTYLATLKAETRGVAAFFTRNRVETYTTLMEEGPDGLLRPLLQIADTRKGKGKKITHRQASYTFDFSTRQVVYRKIINGQERTKITLPMAQDTPVYDFLTAFFNLRLGRLGQLDVGGEIRMAAFSRKGPEEIRISRIAQKEQKRMHFSDNLMLCKVLLSPETFKTKSRDVYVGFDKNLRPLKAVVKNVIGLGDVRGKLVGVVEPASETLVGSR